MPTQVCGVVKVLVLGPCELPVHLMHNMAPTPTHPQQNLRGKKHTQADGFLGACRPQLTLRAGHDRQIVDTDSSLRPVRGVRARSPLQAMLMRAPEQGTSVPAVLLDGRTLRTALQIMIACLPRASFFAQGGDAN